MLLSCPFVHISHGNIHLGSQENHSQQADRISDYLFISSEKLIEENFFF